MGQVYAKTYFPQGYEEWVTGTKIRSSTLIPGTDIMEKDKMSAEDYERYVSDPQSREIIKFVAAYHTDAELKIRNDLKAFLKEMKRENPNIPQSRIIYDSLVGKVLCDFWLDLIEQPLETINKYYADNVPSVEKVFYDVEKKYDLSEFYPASVTIAAYKQYAC